MSKSPQPNRYPNSPYRRYREQSPSPHRHDRHVQERNRSNSWSNSRRVQYSDNVSFQSPNRFFNQNKCSSGYNNNNNYYYKKPFTPPNSKPPSRPRT
ncbi:MAG: hypothetical protein AAFR83_27745, partial [Cyanobacteria bacterium J06629_18]